MGRYARGDIVYVPFDYTDLSKGKVRPALFIADMEGEDCIVCMITKQSIEVKDRYAVPFSKKDIIKGRLPEPINNVRPNRILVTEKKIIIRRVAVLKNEKIDEVIDEIVSIIRG